MSQKKPNELNFNPPDSNVDAPNSTIKSGGWRDGIDTIHDGEYNWLWRHVSGLRDFVTEREKYFYVNSDIGNDSNSGDVENPLETLGKAIEVAGGYGYAIIIIQDDGDQYISENIDLFRCNLVIQCSCGSPGKIIHKTDTTESDRGIYSIRLFNSGVYIFDNPVQIGDLTSSGSYKDNYRDTAAYVSANGKNELGVGQGLTFSDSSAGGAPCCLLGVSDGYCSFYAYTYETYETDGGASGVIVGDDSDKMGIVDCYLLFSEYPVDFQAAWSNINNDLSSGGAVQVSQKFRYPGKITEGNGLPDTMSINLSEALKINDFSSFGDFTDSTIANYIAGLLSSDIDAPFRDNDGESYVKWEVDVETTRYLTAPEGRIQTIEITFTLTDTSGGLFFDKFNPDMPFQPIYITATPDGTERRYGLIEVQKPKPRGHNIRTFRDMVGT